MKVLISEKLSEHKYKTPEGYLICTDAILARTGKQRYAKSELFLDGDDTEVDVDRPYDEVMNEKTIASFENKPVTFNHPNEDVNIDNYSEYAVGYVRDVHQGKAGNEDVLLGNLVITDKDAINAIEEGSHNELSCGYDCEVKDDGNGNYAQHNIRGNHVALCEQGRAGIAKIVDSMEDEAASYLFEYEEQKDDYKTNERWTERHSKTIKGTSAYEAGLKLPKYAEIIKVFKNGKLLKSFNSRKTEEHHGRGNIERLKGLDNMKVRDEDRQLEVYKLCKQNNWYTLGDTEDYEYMLDHADIWSAEKIAMNIANHSHEGFNSILAKIKAKLKDSKDMQSIIKQLCKENNWYANSKPEALDELMEAAKNESMETVAQHIAMHSNETYSSILAKIKAKLKDSSIKDEDSATKDSDGSIGIIFNKLYNSDYDNFDEVKRDFDRLKSTFSDAEKEKIYKEIAFTFGMAISSVKQRLGDSKQTTLDDALKILSIVDAYKKVKDEYRGMVYINGRPMYIIHKKEPGSPEFWGITPSKWGENPRKKFKSQKELDDYLTSVNAYTKDAKTKDSMTAFEFQREANRIMDEIYMKAKSIDKKAKIAVRQMTLKKNGIIPINFSIGIETTEAKKLYDYLKSKYAKTKIDSNASIFLDKKDSADGYDYVLYINNYREKFKPE